MKFSDGNWLMQPGVRAHHPAEVFAIDATGNALTILAPTRPIRHRGDTLQGPLLTLRLSSPLPEVIRVRLEHFTGSIDRGPTFPLETGDPPTTIATADDAVTFTSGRLAARLARTDGWRLDFLADGRRITGSDERGLGYVETDDDDAFVLERLGLGVGECVYGLGERFAAFVKNGQSIDLWNRDGGTGSEQAYKNVPFYLTNRGYGVFVNHPERVDFEVATEKVARVQFSVPGQSLDYFVIYGPTPREILQKYTALTGRPALPPPWSFGLWLTTSFTTRYDEATVTGVLEEMERRALPLSVFHFDCFWMRAFRWCDFAWDPEVFPDPAGMLARLKARGLKICVWINPYIAQASPLFAEAAAQGYLLRRADGSVWQWDLWQPGMGIVDFTHPGARQWYADKLRALLAMGVDSFKTDFGERIPVDDVAWHDGSDPQKMHNFYAYLYNETVFGVLRETRGENEAAVFARAATAGCQRFPVHWGGDCSSRFESMAETLRGGLSLGLCGFGFWSHDIGGFEGMPPADVYKRWLAFGLLSSHSRLHGSSSYRVPWLFDEEAVEVLRHFARLKNRLMPYLFAQAIDAHQNGVPLLRPTFFEFPDDPACDTLDRQYLLGDSLLVAPVFSSDGAVDYYLPEGVWTHLLTGDAQPGGRWHRARHDVFSLPLFVRPNTLLALGARDDRPDYAWAEGATLRLYRLDDGRTATALLPAQDGADELRVSAYRHGDTVTLTASRPLGTTRLEMVGMPGVTGTEVTRP